MKIRLIIIITSFISCNRQIKKTITTTETFDEQAYIKRYEDFPGKENNDILTLKDGTKIHQSLSAKGGASEIIIPPKPAFYKIRKQYSKTSYLLEVKGYTVGNLKIGIWQFFDEKGKLIMEIDENTKLDGHNYHKVLKFLDKEDWIDVETGKGRERFSLYYENDIWHITILSRPWNGNLQTYYEVDANTFKILKKNETQLGDE